MASMKIASPRKRRRVEALPLHSLLPAKEPHRISKNLGFFHLRSIDRDASITTSLANSPGGTICLWSDNVYTVGRKKGRCEIAFPSCRCISRRHCQFFLDGFRRNLLVADGFFHTDPSKLDETDADQKSVSLGSWCSLNGVFVNGRRIRRGAVAVLSVGDEVCLACGSRVDGSCGARCGFVVERVVFLDARNMLDGTTKGISKDLVVQEMCQDKPIARATVLLSMCRSILRSKDPIAFILRSLDLDGVQKARVLETLIKQDLQATTPVSNKKINNTDTLTSLKELQLVCVSSNQLQPEECPGSLIEKAVVEDVFEDCPESSAKRIKQNDCRQQPPEDVGLGRLSDGKTFFLNHLEFMDPKESENCTAITLPQLFHPVGSLERVFIATFTCDVSWFLSCCEMPNHLPITIACHNTERCWSSSSDSRTSMPFSNYPNLILVYPPFPEIIAFGKDRKKQGVGCHHPKFVVLQRADSIRVIVTSANLVSRQWNNITNTVWWQDFPRRDKLDYSAIFTHIYSTETTEDSRSDFASQLAGFMACLIADVPREAYWITELTKYDFGGAVGHLVASLPGMHVQICIPPAPNYILSAMETAWSQDSNLKFLGSVQASVVGLSYRFHTNGDSSGAELKTLAYLLGNCQVNVSGMSEVVLRRITSIPADVNAVGVLVSGSDGFADGSYVQLGFLPRDVAKWVSPLCDVGFFSFSAFIYPKEALAAALGGSNIKVQLILYISQGPHFSEISRLIKPEHLAPLSSLLASFERCMGLWRLQQVLGRYRWPESLETDFIYSSSSIGTSVGPQYLASFAAAAGKRSCQLSDSEESDPEWGCWTANHELKSPSLNILFPTIERVKNGVCGIRSSRCLLSFAEKTWQRLRSSGIVHDAVPHPHDRLGHPMHIKVACRRFQSKTDPSSFGWLYCGSHNFSPAAWGHLIRYSIEAKTPEADVGSILGPRLHICNYELGIIFVFPPPSTRKATDGRKPNLDDIVLPFVMPAPKYQHNDRPATVQAMREVALEEKENYLAALQAEDEMDEEIPDEDEEATEFITEKKEEEKIYAEMLWSQVDSTDSR